jgi:predicted RNase H-like nuclease (RuvC/YqgF family)
MEVAMAECDLIAAYRKDNAELKRKVERLDAHNTYLSVSISELKMHAVNAGREVRDLKRKLAMADHDNSTLADESIAYKERATVAEAELSDMEVRDRIRYNEVMSRALKAERMVERLIEAGNSVTIYRLADWETWAALVAEWQANQKGDSNV